MIMAAIVISDSSDDEIQFFPASNPQPKIEDSDEVIFCGVRKKSHIIVDKRNRGGLSSLSKDVTVKSIRVQRNVEAPPQPDSDLDVEFLGVQKRQNHPNLGTTHSASGVPAPRARSDSLKININSQKSLNTNLTINIEDDAETNKKKVQLTFLGPCQRDEFTPTRPQVMNKTAFKPLGSSTPIAANSLSSTNMASAKPLFNQINQQRLPKTITPQVASNPMKSKENESPTVIINPKFYTRIHPNNLFQKNYRQQHPNKGNDSIINTGCSSNNQEVGNGLIASASSSHNVIDSNEKKDLCLIPLNQEKKRHGVESVKKSDSNPINLDLRENKVVKPKGKPTKITSKNENQDSSNVKKNSRNNKSTESLKNISDSSSNSKKKSVISHSSIDKNKKEKSNFPDRSSDRTESNCNKKTSKAGSSDVTKMRDSSPVAGPSREDITLKDSCSSGGTKTKSDPPAAGSSRQDSKTSHSSGDNKTRCDSPVAGPSRQYSEDSHSSRVTKARAKSPVAGPSWKEDSEDSSSSDSQEEDSSSKENHSDSTSESSDDEPIPQITMSKPALDSLFDKFLDNCTKVNSKKEVIKMKSKMNKLYLSTPNAVKNEDFILALKEVSLRMEKPVRCPLDLMKKVFAQLRIDSPNNEKNIRKLENVLEQVQKKIKMFEEAEVTSDEENDNVYVELDKYRKRAVEIYNKLCELRSVPADAERPTLRNVSFQGVVPDEFTRSTTVQNLVVRVSRALEKYYNKSHKFPDFQDVRVLMTKLSLEGGSKLKSETLHQLSRSLFEEFGDMLQKRRLYDDYKICSEYLNEDQEDPYYEDPILAAKLDANRKLRKKEKEVLNQYSYKQTVLKDDGISDSCSQNSSENDSEEEKDEYNSKRKRSKIQSSSDEKSDSDDTRTSGKDDIIKKRRRTRSSDFSSDSDIQDKKVKKKKTISDKTKEKKISSSKQSCDTKSEMQDFDNRVDESKNKRSYNKLSESDSDSSKKKKLLKSNETLQNIISESKEISIVEDEGDSRYREYENNSTRILNDETDAVKTPGSSDNPEHCADNKNEILICLDDDDDDDPTDNRNQNEPEVSVVDRNIGDPFPVTDNFNEPAGNLLLSKNPDKNNTSQSTCFANNSCGIRITNVTTCQETFSSQNEIQEVVICTQPNVSLPTIDLLSDDEQQDPVQQTPSTNTLSQEDVLELMPIILSKAK